VTTDLIDFPATTTGIEELNRGEEGIKVDVQDRRGAAVDGTFTDLAVAAVLLTDGSPPRGLAASP